MKPRWMEVELKATSFQHGERLTQVDTPEEWKKIVNTSDEPVVLIKKNQEGKDKDEYFYNYYALADPRNIFPENFKLPSLSDFQKSAPFFWIGRNMFKVDTGPIMYFTGYSIEYNGSSNPPSYYFSPTGDMAVQFWTSDSFGNPSERKAARLEFKDGIVSVHETLASKQTGCKVLCIEDIELAYKSRVFDFQCLLPESYDFIKDTITQKIKKGHVIRGNEKLLVTIELLIEKDGKNKSRIVSIPNKKFSKGLVSDIETIIKTMPVLPYYKGTLLSAKSLLTIELNRSNRDKAKVNTINAKKDKTGKRPKSDEKEKNTQSPNSKSISSKPTKRTQYENIERTKNENSNDKWIKTYRRTREISNQSIDGLSIGARLGYPASVLQVKHLFNDKYGRPLHGVDATLNIGEWVDINLIYCYHYNMIKERNSFKLYAGGGMGFGTYFKESPINRNKSYYGNTYNYTVDRRRITFLPIAGMEWTPVRAGGHLKIAFDYRPSIDFLHPSFLPWWNLGWSFRYNF